MDTVHTDSISVWTVFFMGKCVKRLCFCLMIAALVWCAEILSDRRMLQDNLIRFHVVANSDSEEDQRIKLQVRDAVLGSIQEDLQKISNVEEAKEYLRENLPRIQKTANAVLERAGVDSVRAVTLGKESFDTRFYDTFALPAGVYESLRIVIGAGEGHNWWCVTFPTLCLPESAEAFEDTAVAAGFSDSLSETLGDKDAYEVRFFILDKLGQLENILFAG